MLAAERPDGQSVLRRNDLLQERLQVVELLLVCRMREAFIRMELDSTVEHCTGLDLLQSQIRLEELERHRRPIKVHDRVGSPVSPEDRQLLGVVCNHLHPGRVSVPHKQQQT